MEANKSSVGDYAPDFEIPGIDDRVHHLGRYLEKFKAIGVVFIGNKFPQVEEYIQRLKKIQTEFESQGFTLIAINSNDAGETMEESFEAMQSFAREKQLNFPYLRDPTQDVAKSFGAEVIPEAFLLDSQAVIRYAGKIDDSPEATDSLVNTYFYNSISALLKGSEISPSSTKPVGEPIKWRKNKK